MQLSKKELKAILTEAVEAVALQAIRVDRLPVKGERDQIVNKIVDLRYRDQRT